VSVPESAARVDRVARSEPARPSSICLTSLRREFGDRAAVKSMDLEICEGEFFSLIGPSGCGKTTTLRMIAGLEQPTSGRIEVQGSDLTSIPAHRRPVNTVFQSYALFPHLDVFENVAFGLRERRYSKQETAERVRDMLGLVDLEARVQSKPGQLSGGEQQRVALARALVLNPKVLLLDEPLGALDLKLRKRMQLMLKKIQEEVGITFVYVTHDQEEAFFMSDRVAIMNDGELEQVGSPPEVYVRPASLFVADFVGSSNRFPGTIAAVRGEQLYEVELDGIGSCMVEGVPGLAAGERAIAIVRPEAIAPTARDTPGILGFRGTVSDAAYLGPHTSCQVEREGGAAPVTVMQPSRRDGGVGLAEDEASWFGWETGATWLVAG
jgi:spermidine/putrescine transport system ATP-binding protein